MAQESRGVQLVNFKTHAETLYYLPTGCFFKCLPILGGYEAVDDRIDGGVEVEEDSSDVHELLVSHKVDLF